MSKLESIIEQMEDYISSCKPKAFSSTKIDVDREQIEEYLDELRTKCPDEVKKAQKIISNRDRIIEEAQERSDEMIEDTKKKIERMVNEHDIVTRAQEIADNIVKEARMKAEQIVADANRDADEITTGAIQYTDDLLANLEGAIETTLANTSRQFQGFVDSCESSLKQVKANRAELVSEPEAE